MSSAEKKENSIVSCRNFLYSRMVQGANRSLREERGSAADTPGPRGEWFCLFHHLQHLTYLEVLEEDYVRRCLQSRRVPHPPLVHPCQNSLQRIKISEHGAFC